MTKREVALIIHDGVQALDVAGPLDVFAEANGFLPSNEAYDCLLLAADTNAVRASNGMSVVPHLAFAQAGRRFDIALVAGGPSLPEARPDAAMLDWLRNWGTLAGRYGSICTGAFVLGHAGLLDGRVATTHWQNAAQLAASFPACRVEYDRIHARDGALVTSAGVTAGIDLALALVSEDHGEALALACAKRLVVVAQRQGGQSQFSPLLVPQRDSESPIGKVQAYVVNHLAEPFSVERLARIAGTSERTVARLFVKELGQTPHDFVEGVRIDQARNMLEATERPIKAIAFDCGFDNPQQMRAAFQRRLGLSPLRYRESFQSSHPADGWLRESERWDQGADRQLTSDAVQSTDD
ncbi:GlxA family transcriptional regulator [Devosia sp. A449]